MTFFNLWDPFGRLKVHYSKIDELSKELAVRDLCELLTVMSRGYYA